MNLPSRIMIEAIISFQLAGNGWRTNADSLSYGIFRLTGDESNEYYKLRKYAEEHHGSPLWERDEEGFEVAWAEKKIDSRLRYYHMPASPVPRW